MTDEFTAKRVREPVWNTMRRWASNKPQRTYEWQFSPFYWKLLGFRESIKFAVGKIFFTMRDWTRTRRESLAIALEIFKTIIGQVFVAILLVGALTAVDIFLMPHFTKNIAFLPVINQETAADFLGVIAQVAGVFLALYFTAVSVVVSTVYARVPSEIRELLIKEKVGNYYIRSVTLTVAVATLLLAKGAFGFSLDLLDIIIVALLAVVVIFSFIPLGIRIFYFFDPTRLTEYLNYELASWFRAATPKGFQWRNPSFQTHYQKQTERILITYRNIVSMTVKEATVGGVALVRLIMQPLILLKLYAEKKSSIPSESFWFKRTHRHKDWLTTDATEVDMALRSGTLLQPEPMPDFMWLERYVGGILVHAIENLIDRGDLQNAIEILDDVQSTESKLAEYLAIDEALYLFVQLRPLIEKIASDNKSISDYSGEDAENNQLVTLGLLDVYYLGLIGIILGFSKTLQKTNAQSFTNLIGKIRWHKPKTIYVTHMPREVIQQLEYLQRGLNFEHIVGCEFISPTWYQNQIAVLGIARFIERTIEELVKELEITFDSQTKRLVSDKSYLSAAQVIQRGLEACNKFSYHLGTIKSSFEILSTLRSVVDIPWPTPDWENLTKRMLAIKEALVINLAKSSMALAMIPFRKTWPDYFGQSFLVLAEECNSAMATGNEVLFKQIFPAYFNAALQAHDRLRTEIGLRTDQTALVFLTEPIEDLLHISGYALIYSELGGKKYWDTAKERWDQYLNNHDKPKEVIENINSIVRFRQSVFAILPRATLRTGWQIKLEKRLREDNVLVDISDYPLTSDRRIKPEHTSKIIRLIARGTMGTILYDGQDVFLAMYLANRPEAHGSELPHAAQSLLDSMKLVEHDDAIEEDSA
ncbi:MAG: hypothetical protein H8E40_04095 [Chloroflexi bacterium]|nr:hypothetical protein [Chloroflexota bacterium]